MTAPRKSAGIVLTRGHDPEVETYLVERSAQLRFFGGFHAFPGGAIDFARASVEGLAALGSGTGLGQ